MAVDGSLENGKSFIIAITANPDSDKDETSRAASDTVTITYSVVENIDIVFYGAANVEYAYGDYTISGANDFATVTQAPGETIILPDVTVSSGTFKGWRMGDGSIQQSGAEVTVNSDSTVYPVVLSGDEVYPYTVGDNTYCYWEDAVYAAGANGTIILNQDYSLPTTLVVNGVSPAGGAFVTGSDGDLNYSIPAGVTLLIPFDAANTLCTTKPVNAEAYTTPTAYRTLTMASGANITVNGAISLSGQQSPKYGYNGSPYGPLSFIKMNSGSTITVENGGALYAWGYITGSGSVSVKSGGTVYECFQVTDYRGGDVTSSMASSTNASKYGVFPFNQYYLQNIEVPMTLHAGAIEKGFFAVTVTLAGVQTSEVPFIGTENCMFNIESGYIVKDYVEGKGRTDIKIYGDVSASSITISLKVATIGRVTIDSSKYALPIPNHMTITAESGTVTLNQSMSFLPGSELYVKGGAKCILGSGTKLYIYDLDQWLYNNGANGYAGTNNVPYIDVKYAPGGKGTEGRSKDALVQIDGTVDATSGSAYVTAGGANIYSTGTGVVKVATTTDAVAYQVITSGTDISSWPQIAMQPAILQDADGTDVATNVAGTYTYYASTGKWCTPNHRYGDGVVTAPTCTAAGYTTHTCIACGNSYTDNEVPALGHTHSNSVQENRLEATCGKAGSYDEVIYCSVCGEEQSREKKTISATGNHSYDSGKITKDPTADAAGEMTYTCETCGGISTEKVLFQQSTQLGLKEPWFMKSNLYIKVGENYMTQEQLNALVDYGVYFVRASELGITDTSVMPEAIIDHAETVHYSKSSKQYPAVIEKGEAGYMITASYVKGIYTYELADPVYVLYYIEDTAGVHYAEVKLRNLYEIADAAQNNTKFSETEQAVYTCMVTMYDTVTAHRDTFDSIPEMSVHKAPAVTEGYFGTYQENCVVAHSVNVVLIEPWGLRLNGYVNETKGIQDCGVVVFYDKNGDYEEAPTVAQLIANEGAYVFSTSNGNATATVIGEDTKITADYTKDVYTYQLDDKAYAVFFVKIDGVYHFGEVKPRTVLKQIEKAQASDVATETEKAVYAAMLDMYKKVTAHRATFDLN